MFSYKIKMNPIIKVFQNKKMQNLYGFMKFLDSLFWRASPISQRFLRVSSNRLARRKNKINEFSF